MERFVMLQEDEDIAKIENLAKSKACTNSWVYRAVLYALEKKYSGKLPEELEIIRPKKFVKAHRQVTICLYGDKAKWFSLCRIWMVELGPLIRFGLALFEKGELELNLEDTKTNKIVKEKKVGLLETNKINNSCYRYMYHCQVEEYKKNEYWDKNPQRNLNLMKRGLKNRKYHLILANNFKIPVAYT